MALDQLFVAPYALKDVPKTCLEVLPRTPKDLSPNRNGEDAECTPVKFQHVAVDCRQCMIEMGIAVEQVSVLSN